MKKFIIFIILAGLLSASGCSDSSSDSDNSINNQLWKAMYYPQNELCSLLAPLKSNPDPRASGTEVSLSLNGNCGGTSSISGSYSSAGDTVTADVDIDFNDFCYSGITLNGSSDLIISELYFSDTLTYIGTYYGNADVSGDIDGLCTWDLTLNSSAGSLSVHGTITINGRIINFQYDSDN